MPNVCHVPIIQLTFLLLFHALVSGAQGSDRTEFGFRGPEIFPIDNQINQIRAADINGDGRMDLVVVNNSRSRINLLINRTGETNELERPAVGTQRELNKLPADARFKIDSVASEKRISGLVVADLNGDERPDLAYYGEPKELVVQYNEGTNSWSTPRRWAITDGQLTPNALASGDLNGDSRTDLVLLAENHCHLFLQSESGLFGEPVRIPFADPVKSVQVLDIDGDGRDDMLLVNWDSPNPFRFRLQNSRGQLGAEIYFDLMPIRSYWADDLDGDGKTEIVTIALHSGRAQISNFQPRPAEILSAAFLQGQFEVMPLVRTTKARRGAVWADVNGDGLVDLLAAQPDSGQISLFLQSEDGGFEEANTYPALTGISDLLVSDWDEEGRPEIFLLSQDERQVGMSRLDEQGGLPFPTILPGEGRPLVMAAGRLQEDAKPSLFLIREREGRRYLTVQDAVGETRSFPLGESFKANPRTMEVHDVDQDGLADLVVLIPYEKLKILRQKGGGGFEEIDIAPPGGSADQPWMARVDVDGDGLEELMLAQRNFLRAVVLRRDGEGEDGWVFEVKDQINGAGSNSRIVAAAGLKQPDARHLTLFLLDAERKSLTVCERDDAGVWQVVRNILLPASEFYHMRGVGLGSSAHNSIAFLGLNGAAWMSLEGETWEFVEMDGYESPIEDGRLMDVVSGDLNGNGRKDLVFLETARHYVDLVAFEPDGSLTPAARWQVFEERSFRGRTGDQMEPREALVADITGDGLNDLVVLVHDRILLYPQEEGTVQE